LVSALFVFTNCLPAFPAPEQPHADHRQTVARTDHPTIAERIEELRQSVNSKAAARTRCASQGHEDEVEEMTEIVDVSGCNLTVRTRKITTSKISTPGTGQREVEFTIYANLADLTTPASVQPQTFVQCKSVDGPVLKVMSRTAPGKSLRAVRRSSPPNTSENAEQIRRNDLSFFFSDEAKAKKAARALDRAVRSCGGKEWPDEDDLP
jgi:uncharacterized membrane protein